MRVREARGQVPRRAADAAADVQHACGPPRAAPVQHLVHKVNFGALEVLLFVARRALLGRVVAQVDVLAPVVLQDALPARLPSGSAARALARRSSSDARGRRRAGAAGAHCVQLSYSSPTLGASGLYARDGVSSSLFTASASSTRPAASASSRGSTLSGLRSAGGAAWNASTVGPARQAACARRERADGVGPVRTRRGRLGACVAGGAHVPTPPGGRQRAQAPSGTSKLAKECMCISRQRCVAMWCRFTAPDSPPAAAPGSALVSACLLAACAWRPRQARSGTVCAAPSPCEARQRPHDA